RAASTRMRSGALWTLFLSRMKLTSPFLSSGASARTATRTPTAAGSPTLIQRISLSWPLPGSAQRLAFLSRKPGSALVRENVLLGPSGQIQQCAGRQEVEASLGERRPVLTCQTLVQLLLQLVKIADVAGSIIALRVG